MALAIFDLDNTLIANDSDYLWGSLYVITGWWTLTPSGKPISDFMSSMNRQHWILMPTSISALNL